MGAFVARERKRIRATRFYFSYYYLQFFQSFRNLVKLSVRPSIHCSPARYIASTMVYCTVRRAFGIQVSSAFELGSSSLRLPTALWHVRWLHTRPATLRTRAFTHTHTHTTRQTRADTRPGVEPDIHVHIYRVAVGLPSVATNFEFISLRRYKRHKSLL